MSHFKAKMHHIQFRLGLYRRAPLPGYSATPDSLAWFQGAYF